MAQAIKQKIALFIAISLVILPVLNAIPVYADVLLTRSVAIGTSEPGATTTQEFTFTIPGYSDVGSIEFVYCENSPFPGDYCQPAVGQTVASASLDNQMGETGFTIHGSSDAHRLVLSRPAVATVGFTESKYFLSNTVNPSTVHAMVYVRIATFASEDGTGPRIDSGEVIFSTARKLSVNGYVPPFLVFCVGVKVALNCESTEGSLLNFGELSPGATRALTSEFSGSTNDESGFSTTITGNTMTSGNNIIPASSPPKTNLRGTGQFGMNLRANSNPGVGAEPSGPGTLAPVGNFSNQNLFYFDNGQLVAASSEPTDFKKITASYIVNVPADQHPGIYSTTLTYIATASF